MAEAVKTDRRILRTKEAIIKSFLELFYEKGFEHITINEIADRANVNRGTVYLHYKDKYDLLDKCVEEHLRQLFTLCRKGESEENNGGMIRDLQPIFEYLQHHFRFFSAMFTNQRAVVFREQLLQFFSAGLLEKMKLADNGQEAAKELNAQFMSSAFIGIMEWWVRQQMPYDAVYMAARVQDLFEKNEIY